MLLVSILALAVAVVSSGSAGASGDEDVPPHLVEAVEGALHDWSQFAATGDLGVVDASFVPGGPQWKEFESEAGGGEGAAAEKPTLLEARRLRTRTIEGSRATVWAEVEASRSGFRPETHTWDFDLIYRDGEWLVWTVVAADEPMALVGVPQDTVESSTTTSLPSPRLAVGEQRDFDRGAATSEVVTVQGTRIPAVSAWVIVITLVGVATAGYLAPRMDRKGEQ